MPMPPRFAVNKTSGAKSPSTHTSSSSSSSEESNSGSSESSESSGSESSSDEGGSPKQRKRLSSPDRLVKKGSTSKVRFIIVYLTSFISISTIMFDDNI